jgi:hypothetical protein
MDVKEYTKLKEFIRQFQAAGVSKEKDSAFKVDFLSKMGINTSTLDRADIFATLYIFADLAYANGIILENTFMDLDNNLMGFVENEDYEFYEFEERGDVSATETDLIRQEITASNLAAMANRSLNFRKG